MTFEGLVYIQKQPGKEKNGKRFSFNTGQGKPWKVFESMLKEPITWVVYYNADKSENIHNIHNSKSNSFNPELSKLDTLKYFL